MLETILLAVVQGIASAAVSETVRNLGPLLQMVPELMNAPVNLDKIKREFESIQAFLKDAERKKGYAATEGADGVFQVSVDQVQECGYKVEDILDEFLNFVHRREGRGLNGFTHNVLSFTDDLSVAKRFSKDIESITAEAVSVANRRQRYDISPEAMVRGSNGPTLEPAGVGVKQRVFGAERYTATLIKYLTSGGSSLSLVSICGMGGLGKTTLAREAYNHIQVAKHFKARAWVPVSQSCSMKGLLHRIAEELREDMSGPMKKGLPPIHDMSEQQLSREVTTQLGKLRYLIVLDDVWTAGALNGLFSLFPDNEKQSRILITSRNRGFASFVSRTLVCKYLDLEPLSNSAAQSLFNNVAFSASRCPEHLQHWSSRIVERCDGQPLAIVTIGRLMSTKKNDAVTEWERMYNHLQWELNNNEHLEAIFKTLMVSYNNLTPVLKACFLYCTLFPEDHMIKAKTLVRMWVAEGFIPEQNDGKTLEQRSLDYLNSLVDHSMLEATKRDVDGRVKICRIHDIMRELGAAASRGENFCAATNQNMAEVNKKTRRLSITENVEVEQVQRNDAFRGLRSLLVFNSHPTFINPLEKLCKQFRLLRVLNLAGASIESLPFDVYKLFNLRYLSVRETKVGEILNNVENLYNLQTLDLWKTNVKQLPREVLKLRHLRHLLVDNIDTHGLHYKNIGHILRGKDAPSGIKDWSHLQTLRNVKAGNSIFDQLGHLTQLRSLGVKMLETNHTIPFCKSLSKLKFLERLSVTASPNNRLTLEGLLPAPDRLRKLILNGRMSNVPKWFSSLHCLTHLYLFNSCLNGSPVDLVHNLRSLVLITLDDASNSQELHFTAGGFLKLRTMILANLKNLSKVVIDKAALPSIELLYISSCMSLKVISGKEYLNNQLRVKLEDVPSLESSAQ